MGKLIWHQWGRLMALTAATYMTWASLWAFAYRKFFWDFVGGSLGPTGLIPNSTARVFNKIIIDIPLLQVFTLLLALSTLVIELPLRFVVGTAIHRSHILRIGVYLTAAFIGFLVYQTFDCALYFVIATSAYVRSMILEESIVVGASAKERTAV